MGWKVRLDELTRSPQHPGFHGNYEEDMHTFEPDERFGMLRDALDFVRGDRPGYGRDTGTWEREDTLPDGTPYGKVLVTSRKITIVSDTYELEDFIKRCVRRG